MPIRATNIDDIINQTTEEFEKWVRQIGVTLDQVAVDETPVVTGRARGGWIVEFGRFTLRQTDSTARPDTQRAARWKSGDGNIYIHNSVEYIVYLEAGISAQAEDGMLGPAIDAVRARFG